MARHGPPRTILTDNATTFGDETIRELEKLMLIKHIRSTPTHSRGNAVVERVNQTIGDKLALIIWGDDEYQRENWVEAIPFVAYSINVTRHSSTGFSPFELVYGRQPQLINELVTRDDITVYQLYSKFIKLRLDSDIKEAYRTNKESQMRSRQYFDASHQPKSFEVGDVVWLHKKEARRPKLRPRYDGPYVIIAKKPHDVYELKHLEIDKKGTILRHVSALKVCHGVNTQEIAETSSSDENEDYQDASEGENTDGSSVNDSVNLIQAQEPRRYMGERWLKSLVISVVLSLSGFITPILGSEHILTAESPILWKRTEKFVITGLTEYEYMIIFETPCNIFVSFTPDNNLNSQYFTECQTIFKSVIIERINVWCSIIPESVVDDFEIPSTSDELP